MPGANAPAYFSEPLVAKKRTRFAIPSSEVDGEEASSCLDLLKNGELVNTIKVGQSGRTTFIRGNEHQATVALLIEHLCIQTSIFPIYINSL